MPKEYHIELTVKSGWDREKIYFSGSITDTDTARIMDWLMDHIEAPDSEELMDIEEKMKERIEEYEPMSIIGSEDFNTEIVPICLTDAVFKEVMQKHYDLIKNSFYEITRIMKEAQ